ncbi:MAG TPA: hypothetical protein VL137_06120, partial [Polyangiaceae bacterium]|nr:hypothetical protein [Polyangiaceae bacterium]
MASSLLRAISDELDRGDVKNAQQLLATADPTALDADGLSYLTTRLLLAQKRLSAEQAAERLLDLTSRLPDFQEAVQMLRQIAPHLAPASSAARPPSHPAEAPRRSPLPPADAPRRSPLPPAETPRRSPLPPAVRPGAAAIAAAAVAARAKMKGPAAKAQQEKAVQTPAAPAAVRAPSIPPPAAKPDFDDFDDFEDPFASPASDPPLAAPPAGASAPMMRHSQPPPARPASIPPAAARSPSASPAQFPSMPPLADSGHPAAAAPVRSPAVDPQLNRSPSMPPPGRSPSMPPAGRSPSMPPPGGRSPSMPPPGGRAPSVPSGPRTPSMAPSPIVSPLHQPSVRPAGESIAPPPPSNRGAALYASVSPAKRYSGNAPSAGSLSSDEGDSDFVIPRDPPAQRAPSIIPAFRNRTPLPWSTDPPPSAGAPAPRIPAFPGIPSVGIPGTSGAQPKGPAALGHSDRPPAIMSPPPSIREARPKSLLPPGAGKYSAKPPETESIRPRNSPVPASAPPVHPPKRSSPRPPPVSERDPRSGRRSSPKPPPIVEQDARAIRRSSPRPPPVVEQDARAIRRSSPRPPPAVEHEPPLRRSSPRPPPMAEQAIPLRRSSPRPPPMDSAPPSMRTLDEADALVLAGKHEAALAVLTSSAATQLQPFTQALRQDEDFNPAVLGTVAASFLNVGPVTREFAPYDLSLHSLARLEAALEVLFGADPLPAPDAKNPLLLLLGQYV